MNTCSPSMVSMSRSRVLWVSLVALLLGAISVVRAQATTTTTSASTTTTTLAGPTTHLQCYRVKDPLRLKGPAPSWLALAGPQVSAEQCAIVGSFRLVCLPVTKTITQPIERSIGGGAFTAFTPVSVPNEEVVTQDRICYRIKCNPEAVLSTSTLFIDQFGSRMVTSHGAYLLCGPGVTASCGNGIVEVGEACDDGSAKNGKNGDCCSATCAFVAAATTCPDTDGNACTVPQCDGAGTCNQSAAFTAAGAPCADTDGNGCTVAQCDGAGTCNQSVFSAAGTPCADTDGNACTVPQCDGAGTCNQSAAFTAAGTPCPDTDQNQCTHAGCDGAGTCAQAYFVRNCTLPATCNPTNGLCQ